MQIRCPVCDYSREVNLEKVPATSEFATCPKCRHRFRFRAVDLDAVQHNTAPPEPNPEHADVWDAVDSLQDRWTEKHEEHSRDTDFTDDSDERPYHGMDQGAGHGTGYEADHGPDQMPDYGQPAPSDTAVPWEAPRHLGYGQSFWRTSLWAFLQPASFFATLSRRPALFPALTFYLIFGCVQYVLNVIWTYALGHMVSERFIETMGEEAFQRIIGNLLEHSLFTPAILSVPFQLAIQLFITAGVVHLLIRIISPATADFALAFKVVAYASVGFALVAIPVLGTLAAPLWYFALLFIGCRNAFAMPWDKTLLAMMPLYLLLALSASAQYSMFLGG